MSFSKPSHFFASATLDSQALMGIKFPCPSKAGGIGLNLSKAQWIESGPVGEIYRGRVQLHITFL